ncbi:MAG: TnsA-like heteromeric transposase endonuclease subunit [Actinobacteria bacterium]|nr:TnsA-like heteromeric transposase endonuclease subunit [Actinomycetota bacterium]
MATKPRQRMVEFRYTSHTGEDVTTTLGSAPPAEVARGLPVRSFPSYAGMGHYPGWWWSATVGDHVGYESLLERDRLMLADFDRDVVAILSQPFGISGRDGDALRRHVPDYLLLHRNGTVEVVDVKPADMLDKPDVAVVLNWTGRLLAERGWRYSIWSGADPIELTNVRFLAQGRRSRFVDSDAMATLARAGRPGRTLGAALAEAARSPHSSATLRAALITLLWKQTWQVALDQPIDMSTEIRMIRGVHDKQRCS